MNIIHKLLESMKKDEQFDVQDVMSKLSSAQKNKDIEKNCVGFVLEELDKNTNKVKFVKVFVAKDDAKAFESTLAAALDEYSGKKEIAEILFLMREKFNIVNVEWPEIPEDEEVQQELPDGEAVVSDIDIDNSEADINNNTNDTNEMTDQDTKSILRSIIDMMRADAEAKKAEAEAKVAEYATDAALASVKKEEEVLDMEIYYKEKEEKKKEAEKLAKLAKFKYDRAKELESHLDMEDADVKKEISTSTKPEKEVNSFDSHEFSEYTPATKQEDEEVDSNEDGYVDDEEYFKYIEKFLKRPTQAQE